MMTERDPDARGRIERRAAEALGRRFAVFTWSLADAVAVVLQNRIATRGAVAVPLSAPPAVLEGIEAAGHVALPVSTHAASLQFDPDALRRALDGSGVAAVVAWRPAGQPLEPALAAVLGAASVPVFDALPRTPGPASSPDAAIGPSTRPAATCLVVGDGRAPAAVVGTDDVVLADLVRTARCTGPALDRWAATMLASLHEHDALGAARLAAGHRLLLDLVDELPLVASARAGVTGWGGAPELVVAGQDGEASRLRTVLAASPAVDVARWADLAPPAFVDAAVHRADPVAGAVCLRLPIAPSPAEVEALAQIRADGTRGSIAEGDEPAPPPGAPLHRHRRLHQRAAKRSFDLLVGTGLLVVTAPLMAAVAFVVWLVDGSPVVFRQVRVGRHGVPFEMLKFRTMEVEADERLGQLLDRNQRAGPLFKLDVDPRVTALGRILRRCSLDELPQLINVVNGTMSLVGPRPALPRERVAFPSELVRRECVRPGMTGLWQVQSRDDASFERYAELDLDYVDHHDLARDVRILAQTPAAVYRTARRRAFAGPHWPG